MVETSPALEFLRRFIPLFDACANYDLKQLRSDLIAGLTTAVLLVPQGMAYALLAGLPPVVGLYASLVPAIAYAFIGTSRQLSVGPVAMDSLLVATGVGAISASGSTAYLEAAVLLALMVGALQILFGVLRLGLVVNFLSRPVMSGFTSAAAILIALSQLKHLLGVPLASTTTAWGVFAQLPAALADFSPLTLVVGMTAVIALVSLEKYLPLVPAPLLVVSLGTLVVGWGGLEGQVAIVGNVPPGLPEFSLPHVDWSRVTRLLPVALSIALVAFMEAIAVSETYAQKHKYSLSANRELVALGSANVLGSLFSGYPVTGGFSRTAVNARGGARTQVAGLVTVLLVGLSLVFLTPLFYYLPKAALSAIIIVAVFGLIDLAEVQRLKKIKRSDLALLGMTFFATLALGAAPGLGVGVLASLGWFVYRTTRPHVAVLGRIPGSTQFRNIKRYRGLVTYQGILIVRLDAQYYFGNVHFLKETLAELETKMPEELKAVVLDASAINAIDSSGEAALRQLDEEYSNRGVKLYLTGVKGPVRDVLRESGLEDSLGKACQCLSVHEALSILDARPHRPPQRFGRLNPDEP